MDESRIIRFAVDTKHRKEWFTDVSFSHPAKMSLPLQKWCIEKFTNEGDTVLDPMAGSGSILVACSMGRNVIAVELEQKFIEIIKGNWQKIQQRGAMMGYRFGQAQILQGDARNLTGLLADKVISSPPFQETEVRRSGQVVSRANYDYGSKLKMQSEHPDNISRLAENNYGDIDKIVTSPPYAQIEIVPGRQTVRSEGLSLTRPEAGEGYNRSNSKNIGNLPYGSIDKVVTSPPYEGQMDGGSRHTKGGIPERDKKMKRLGSYITDNKSNIGNMYKDSYLEAMYQVYRQCHAVLKSGGLMVLVTKNFIRNKEQVRLDEDTIKICEKAGFKYLERYYRKLSAQSFWRIIYHQRYPSVPPIIHEDILVFGK